MATNMDDFFEGDMVLTPAQKEMMESSSEEGEEEQEGHDVSKRAVQKNLSDRWNKGIVPYVLAPGLRKSEFCVTARVRIKQLITG